MTTETKLLKTYLKKEFPDHYFSLKIVRPYSYLDSSDKILIKTDMPYEQIKKVLVRITSGIAIYRKNEIASIYGMHRSKILELPNTLVEFIEIENI